MKKILIISYFFPPCNLTPASRIGSWEKYLPENGIYPIIVTRNWTGKELTEQQRLENSGVEKRIAKKENSTIYYLPYKSSLRDRFYIKGKDKIIYAYISKLLTFFYLILQNFSLEFIPYKNLYKEARILLKEDSEIETLVISGNPFEQFYFGYLLKKEFPYIKWIADYRDEWTSSELNDFGWLRKQINHLHAHFEKKWVKSSTFITANTNYAVKKLSILHNKRTVRLLNGFDDIQEKQEQELNYNSLEILHNGTLYPTQKLDLLKGALSEIVLPENFKLIFSFPGIKIKKAAAQYVQTAFADLPVELKLTDRIPKQEILDWQHKADLFLMVAHQGKKGIVGSKLYEYLSFKKQVLLCPTDEDELEETLQSSGLGIIVRNETELKQILRNLVEEKISKGRIDSFPNDEKIDTFARRTQVKILAELL